MTTDPGGVPASPSVDAALERIRSKVAERRERGEYPPGLEDELDRHYQQLMSGFGTTLVDTADVRAQLARLDAASAFGSQRIELASRNPAGATLHKGVAKVTARQTNGVLEQVQSFADVVRLALAELTDAVEELGRHGHSDMERRLGAVLDRLHELAPVVNRLDDLERRIDKLESRTAT